MSIAASRAERRQLARDNAKLPRALQPVPPAEWPQHRPRGLLRVWRSRDYLVQEFSVPADAAIVRISVNRTSLNGDRWLDGIPWDDLQRIKAECGWGDHDAVEVYPRDADVVNVANMRHLWVMEAPLSFAWRRGGDNDPRMPIRIEAQA